MIAEKTEKWRRAGHRYETCAVCGREWNIALEQRISPAGYVCPSCSMKGDYNERYREDQHGDAEKSLR